ncbi:MAG TPA: GNAT family N-acetyltransferase [Candidatus Ozemobacteraceae bacterium]|nr:GNAT family N-acetyltransferase [Candidatus Ozemobacteraceae bacterium]
MSDFYFIHDRKAIAEYLKQHTDLHIYEIGDLDDFFWPHTMWFADAATAPFSAMCMLYAAQSQPSLLALGAAGPLTHLLRSITRVLPTWFYTHITPGAELAFAEGYQLKPHGDHLKMSLRVPAMVAVVEETRAVRLGPENLAEVLNLYKVAYPGNWFDPRMLETREYFGIREGGQLVSIAGVHVYSATQRVAALGNITTHPAHRKRGLAKIVTRKLCSSLLEKVDYIGLNVAADNQAAIGVYRKLGFEVVAPYREYAVAKVI